MADPTGYLSPRPPESDNSYLQKILRNLALLPSALNGAFIRLDGTSTVVDGFYLKSAGSVGLQTAANGNITFAPNGSGHIQFSPAGVPPTSATETGMLNLMYSGTLPDDNNLTYGLNCQWSGPAGAAGANVRAVNTFVTATGTTNLGQLSLWTFRNVNGLTSGTVANQEFASGTVRITGGGDTSNGYGYRMQSVASSTGKFANFFKNFEARSPSITGGSTNPLSYGFYSAAQKVTGVTTGYGFYQAGASDLNYFEGAVQLPSTNTAGIQLYNTADQTTNYERLETLWSSNTAYLRVATAGTGTTRSLALGSAGGTFTVRASTFTSGIFDFSASSTSTPGAIAYRFRDYTNTATSGTNIGLSLTPTYNQASGTAANTDLLINRTETAVGSGTQNLIQGQVGGVDKFVLSNSGAVGTASQIRVGGVTFVNSRFSVASAVAGYAAWTTNGAQARFEGGTFTDTSTAGSGTAASATFTSFAAPTLAATNASVTTTDAATVYIANAPTAGTNQTITNPWALWIAGGKTRNDGAMVETPQTFSGAGAISSAVGTTHWTSTGGAQALTLANGTVGQLKRIVHVVDGGSGVLTPTTKVGFTTITFTNAGDAVTLQYTSAGWAIVGIFGAVAA